MPLVLQATGSDAVAVAGVNATILSILAAAALVYVAVILGTFRSMRDEILDEAAAIVQLGQDRFRSLGKFSSDHPWEKDGYDARDSTRRRQLLSNLSFICYRQEAWLQPVQEGKPLIRDPSVPRPDEPVERAQWLISTLSLLSRTYPLADETFSSPAEVERWRVQADEAAYAGFQVEQSKNYVEEIVGTLKAERWDKLQEDLRTRVEHEDSAGVRLDATAQWAGGDPTVMLAELRAYFQDVQARLSALWWELMRFRRYSDRLPSRAAVRAIVVAAVVAFVAGVIVPLIETDSPRIIYVGIPGLVYGLALVALAAWTFRRYRR